jgi:hypothetical protein
VETIVDLAIAAGWIWQVEAVLKADTEGPDQGRVDGWFYSGYIGNCVNDIKVAAAVDYGVMIRV